MKVGNIQMIFIMKCDNVPREGTRFGERLTRIFFVHTIKHIDISDFVTVRGPHQSGIK